jgi:hypothetical protein
MKRSQAFPEIGGRIVSVDLDVIVQTADVNTSAWVEAPVFRRSLHQQLAAAIITLFRR